jgi:malate synthase
VLDDGRKVTMEMFRTMLGEELRKVSAVPGASSLRYDEAAWLLDQLVSNDEFQDFLTEPAYELIAREQVAIAA